MAQKTEMLTKTRTQADSRSKFPRKYMGRLADFIAGVNLLEFRVYWTLTRSGTS